MNSLVSVLHCAATLQKATNNVLFPLQGVDCVFILCPQERSGACVCVCELNEGDIRCVRETREEKEREGKGGRGSAERQGLKQQWRKSRECSASRGRPPPWKEIIAVAAQTW